MGFQCAAAEPIHEERLVFIAGGLHQVFIIGFDSPLVSFTRAFVPVNVTSIWTVVPGGREFQHARSAFEGHDALNDSLPVRPFTYDDRPVVVLKARGKDLAGARAERVQKQNHRDFLGDENFRFRPPDFLHRVFSFGGHEDAVRNEEVTHFDRDVKVAAGVEPQIENQALER